jgi:hypothetical protein
MIEALYVVFFKHPDSNISTYQTSNLSRRIFPYGQADLLCCGAFAVYEYGFIRRVAHIDL